MVPMRSDSNRPDFAVGSTSLQGARNVAATLVLAAAMMGCKAHIPASTSIDGSVDIAQPAAYDALCQRHAQLCDVPDQAAARAEVILDKKTFRDLREVNYAVNRDIRYRSDAEVHGRAEFWTVAAPGASGDCEDFALTKLQRLLDRGFPRDALRLAIVHRARDGIQHAVLTVKTDRGVYVLDSSYDRIMPWARLPYKHWMLEKPGTERWDVVVDDAERTAELR
jgi:predicted transglutaminase-like cysteine proteinase